MLRRLWINHRIVLYGMFLFGLWAGGYYATGALAKGRAMGSVILELDQMIPFIPQFVFIYLTIYPIFLLPFLIVVDREFFKVFGSAYLTVMLICYAIYLFYPVSSEGFRWVAQVEANAATNFSYWALAKVYHSDTVYNCFPSTHGALSLMSALTLLEINRRWGFLALLATLSIGASTLLTKQHFIIDIFAGYALAMLVYYIYFKQRIIEALPNGMRRLEGRIGTAIDERIARVLDRSLEQRIDAIIERKLNERLDQPDPPGTNKP